MKMIKPLRVVILIIILNIFPIGCTPEKTEIEFKVETFQIANSGWGYKIYKRDKSFIVQHNIPAIPRKLNFQSEKDASQTGNLMIQKLRQNLMPSVTVVELDSMKIKYD